MRVIKFPGSSPFSVMVFVSLAEELWVATQTAWAHVCMCVCMYLLSAVYVTVFWDQSLKQSILFMPHVACEILFVVWVMVRKGQFSVGQQLNSHWINAVLSYTHIQGPRRRKPKLTLASPTFPVTPSAGRKFYLNVYHMDILSKHARFPKDECGALLCFIQLCEANI